jgi:hypothetical protein
MFMKKGIIFFLLIASFSVRAQSLKDLLYSGKLKKDSNTVIRKGDDLSSKIDTSTKKPADIEKPKTTQVTGDSLAKQTNSSALQTSEASTSVSAASTPAPASVGAAAVAAPGENNAPAKNNNQVLKEYMDSLVSTLKTDVLPSNKIKKETYYLYVDYEIETDGVVTVTNVVSSPENSFLQQQVKDRILLDAPKLSPVLDSSNKPRKVKRKYNFNITKE